MVFGGIVYEVEMRVDVGVIFVFGDEFESEGVIVGGSIVGLLVVVGIFY